MTKSFLGDSSRKFVNGVLGAVYLEVKDPNEEEHVPKKIPVKKSVGGVVFRVGDDKDVQFAFVHDIFGRWTLSKGGLDEGEKDEDGLKRVIEEEIGITVTVLEKIGSNSYVAHPPDGPIRKDVVYFLAETKDENLQLKETEGLDEAKWFSYNEAKNVPFYPDLKQIILDGMVKATDVYAKKTDK